MRQSILGLAVAVMLVGVGRAETVWLDTDTTIDADNSFPDDDLMFNSVTVNIMEGGEVGGYVWAYSGGTINMYGGTVGDYLGAYAAGTINMSGGTVEGRLWAYSSNTVNISGGSISTYIDAYIGNTVNISGGSIGTHIATSNSNTINIHGYNFDQIGDRLAGRLADGTPFDTELRGPAGQYVLHTVPEPSTLILLATGAVGLLFCAWRRRRRAA